MGKVYAAKAKACESKPSPSNHSLISVSWLNSGSYNEEMGPLIVSCFFFFFRGMKYYPVI